MPSVFFSNVSSANVVVIFFHNLADFIFLSKNGAIYQKPKNRFSSKPVK